MRAKRAGASRRRAPVARSSSAVASTAPTSLQALGGMRVIDYMKYSIFMARKKARKEVRTKQRLKERLRGVPCTTHTDSDSDVTVVEVPPPSDEQVADIQSRMWPNNGPGPDALRDVRGTYEAAGRPGAGPGAAPWRRPLLLNCAPPPPLPGRPSPLDPKKREGRVN